MGGCTHLPGTHPSSRAVCVSQWGPQVLGCTHLWGLHQILGAALISQGVPISWRALILRGCTDLGGLHPSPRAHLSSGAASIFGSYVPGCTHLRGSPPLWGAAPCLWGASTSGHSSTLQGCTHLSLVGTHLRVPVGAWLGGSAMPWPWGCHCGAAVGPQHHCPHVPSTICGHRLLPTRSCWCETGYF